MTRRKSILVFGAGELQRSILRKAKARGLFTVGIDPCPEAVCRDEADAFELVDGQDYEGTLAVAEKYGASAVVTAATDKPLVMMARVAEALGLNCFSVETARNTTDKFLMKQVFEREGIPCARGRTVRRAEETAGLHFPLILKPRDNSGSRGVLRCDSPEEVEAALRNAFAFSRKDSVLAEEYIEGREYSIEGLHFNGRHEVIQFTEKTTTPFPYNVELQHLQPARLDEGLKAQIRTLIDRLGRSLRLTCCASHTELKINRRGCFIIETSPRLGGDRITSLLTPLSTGIDIEAQLLRIVLGEPADIGTGRVEKAAGIRYFSFPEGRVTAIDPELREAASWPGVAAFRLGLQAGDRIGRITHSLDRYGELAVRAEDRAGVKELLTRYGRRIRRKVQIENLNVK